MFQVIFNALSAAELSALPMPLQLNLLGEFQVLPEDLDRPENDRFGLIERGGKKLYRYRASDYRSDRAPHPAQEHDLGFSVPLEAADGGRGREAGGNPGVLEADRRGREGESGVKWKEVG